MNLEYLARVVFKENGILYPDSVVGTDSHTTMINGLGVLGWGVGGIEGEAVMLGQHISMVLPEVVGVRLSGRLRSNVNATDLVLTLTEILRKRGVVGKFVEYFGPGVSSLTIEDRSTLANMAPEYGATCGFFPVDDRTFDYLLKTGRPAQDLRMMRDYLNENMLLRNYEKSADDGIGFSGDVIDLDLSQVQPSVAGPKRPQDRVPLSRVKYDFEKSLVSPVSNKNFGVKADDLKKSIDLDFHGKKYKITHGTIMISSITSCTNTSNPEVLFAAGLLAKNAVARGLNVLPYIKTSLSPGSGVVETYLKEAGLLDSLEKLGFYIAGLGCMTCIGNSGDLLPEVTAALQAHPEIVVASVLSGNRNFEGRVHPLTKANFLASPPLCVAYALAGTVDIDFEKQPIGKDKEGKEVFLKDIWPQREEIRNYIDKFVTSDLFKENYSKIEGSNPNWNALDVSKSIQYEWDKDSTYIRNPPFFAGFSQTLAPIPNIRNARCLLYLGDSITTDHISPAGNIAKDSPSANYLKAKGIGPKDFNSYGARRGNYEIMARGTFANIRLANKLIKKTGPNTVHIPSGKEGPIFDIAQQYIQENIPTIIIAGQEYGSGSSRDWAAKGPQLLGVKAVIAQSYERIHRSNLVGMGILPLEFLPGQNMETLKIDPKATFDIDLKHGDLKVREKLTVKTGDGKSFEVIVRIDTPIEVDYFKNGGILPYVLRKMI